MCRSISYADILSLRHRLKVIHLNHSDISGGAARAAYRIHHSLREAGVDSWMWVNKATAGDWTVEGPATKVAKALAALRGHAVNPLVKTLKTSNPIIHSPSILPSQWIKRINASDAESVQLQWVQGEMLSIADIGRITKPIVWTLHDMWAFCGAEHYTQEYRWREGYARDNRPAYESGFDLNRWTWERKRKHWLRPMHVVTPSHWLADCARESALMRGWPVRVVANCLDTHRWQPVEQILARQLLGLPLDAPLLLFGAMGGGSDPRKGFDLLASALDHLRGKVPGLQLVVFGQLAPLNPLDLGFPVHYTGHLHDDVSLRLLYSAADALVVPSRQDNLPNTAVEAQVCGTPVVAFNVGGLADIVEHNRTGYLANAFDCADLAAGVLCVLEDGSSQCSASAGGDRIPSMREQSRALAVSRFSNSVVAEMYQAVYAEALNLNRL